MFLELFIYFILLFRATPAKYGGSQASRQIGALCSCWPTPQPQQSQICASSATYTTAHDILTIEPSWILVGLVSTAQQRELPFLEFFSSAYFKKKYNTSCARTHTHTHTHKRSFFLKYDQGILAVVQSVKNLTAVWRFPL